ncbi:MAG: rhombotarget lipoprotein [Gammaproteobacteria bacterium]|nr:rhombotarget lipoprotein [Gammaproteobacteria bacterium]
MSATSKNIRKTTCSKLCLSLLCTLSLAGCSAFFYSPPPMTNSSSMVEFLYPDGQRPENEVTMPPTLELPLRIGIAFVPPKSSWGSTVSHAEQIDLLNIVKQQFENEDYVETIEVLSSSYLQGVSGFQALEQIGSLLDLDVFALVSWNQVVTSDDTPASLLYWTIIGAYTIPGTRNSVNTLLDVAVFDLKSRKLLLRAPGVSSATDTSTAISAGRVTKSIRDQSLTSATNQMAENLAFEVERFSERVKEEGVAEITYGSNYQGSFSPLLVFFGMFLAGVHLVRRRFC